MARGPGGEVRPLYSAAEIAQAVERLALAIKDERLDDLLIVAILKGSFVFAADLVRALQAQGLSPEIDFLFLASYAGEPVSTGAVRVLHDIETDLAGRDVVIVDDIFDSGRTLHFAKERLAARGAKRVLTCVLVDKRVLRSVPLVPDFTGFVCEPVFVVGYGMDLRNRFRELPYIAVVEPGA